MLLTQIWTTDTWSTPTPWDRPRQYSHKNIGWVPKWQSISPVPNCRQDRPTLWYILFVQVRICSETVLWMFLDRTCTLHFKVCCCCSVAQLCPTLATPWTVAYQAPLSMEFSKQEYQSGLSFPSPGDIPDPGMKSTSAALAGELFTTEPPGKSTSKHVLTFFSIIFLSSIGMLTLPS